MALPASIEISLACKNALDILPPIKGIRFAIAAYLVYDESTLLT